MKAETEIAAHRGILIKWLIAGAGLLLCAFVLRIASPLFGPDVAVQNSPVALFSGVYVLACAGSFDLTGG